MDQIQFVFDQQPIENVFMVPVEIEPKSAFNKHQEIIDNESKENAIKDEANDNSEELKDQESIMIQSLSSLKFVQSKIESVCLFGKSIDELGKAEIVLEE
jgi:hypothetical protein